MTTKTRQLIAAVAAGTLTFGVATGVAMTAGNEKEREKERVSLVAREKERVSPDAREKERVVSVAREKEREKQREKERVVSIAREKEREKERVVQA